MNLLKRTLRISAGKVEGRVASVRPSPACGAGTPAPGLGTLVGPRVRPASLALWLWAALLLGGGSSRAGGQRVPPRLPEPSPPADPFRNLSWRAIGPAVFGGRISDVEADPHNPAVIYVAASTGGIFKSTNHGVSWRPIFDGAAPTLSIGDMALAPSDPLVLWVGTGEANGEQQPASVGHGVYRSLDGGETWSYMGLGDTRFIHRVVVHPRNPEIVFVAAPGHRWGPNEERGLFRTLDGGRTWSKVLYVDEHTGVTEVAMEDNGRVLYAATWQQRRHAWGNLTGGPRSAIYRSLDGGDTWQKLENGLPTGNLGKIAIAVAKSRPNVVYAAIGDSAGGFYRSEDRGNTWTRVNDIRTSYWYGNIYVDPWNENKVWVMGVQLAVSMDGGRTFETEWTARGIHVDHHALWIDPKNPDHMLLGNDGGFHVTFDGARSWSFLNNLPIGQTYAVAVDNSHPYLVYGGLQDNGTWGVPAWSYSRVGILNEDAFNVGGGDGFVPAAHPLDPMVVYVESQYGALRRVDRLTGRSVAIAPTPRDTAERYRFNWNSPLLISPHDPEVLYFGGNKLFRSRDRGESWEVVSGDLTKNENPAAWDILGLKPSLRPYNTLTAVEESPLRRGLLYVGADDGSVHRSADGGTTWEALTRHFSVPVPQPFVTAIHASRSLPERAYVAFTGHYHNDLRPYLFRTDDAGGSWTLISGGMPSPAVVLCVVEWPGHPEVVLAGVHNGLLLSWNGGRSWSRVGGGLPPVSVNDIEIKDGDLILGTYGRGIYIVDDASFLGEMRGEILGRRVHLFPVREAELYYPAPRDLSNKAAPFVGPNRPYGALITYFVGAERAGVGDLEAGVSAPGVSAVGMSRPATPARPPRPASVAPARVEILDREGSVIRVLEGPAEPGIHRVVWDLRREAAEGGQGPQRRPSWVDVEPGNYRVRLRVGEAVAEGAVRVVPDRRRK